MHHDTDIYVGIEGRIYSESIRERFYMSCLTLWGGRKRLWNLSSLGQKNFPQCVISCRSVKGNVVKRSWALELRFWLKTYLSHYQPYGIGSSFQHLGLLSLPLKKRLLGLTKWEYSEHQMRKSATEILYTNIVI